MNEKFSGFNDLVNVSDIKIPSDFARFVPSTEKIRVKAKYFREKGFFDKPIKVVPEINEKGYPNRLMLVDGYINYFIAICNGLDKVPVIYQHEYLM